MKIGLLLIAAAVLTGESRGAIKDPVFPRDRILLTLKQSIELHRDPNLRKKAQDHYIENVRPAMDTAVDVLARGTDGELMTQVFALVTNTASSLDEELTIDLGKIFQTNSNLFETEYQRLNSRDKVIVWSRLELGWENLMHERERSPKDVRLAEKLQRLRPN